MERYLAHKIVCDGKEYPLSIAELSDDRRSVRIYPYTEEIHSTAWVDGTLRITLVNGRYCLSTDRE